MDENAINLRDEVGRAALYQAAVGAVGLAGSVLFARRLGPDAFGSYYLLYALAEIFDRTVSGVGEAAKKRISAGAVPPGEAVGATVLTALLAGAAGGVLGVVADDWLVGFTGVPHAGLWFVLLFASLGAFESLQVVVTADGQVDREKFHDLLHRAQTVLLQVAGVALLGGAAGMAAGLTGATLLAVQYPLRAVARPTVPGRATLRSLWRYARYAAVERATVQTWNRVNLVLLGWLATSAVTGQFTVARDLSSPALFVVGATAAGVMAQVSDRHGSDEHVTGVIRDALAHSSVLAVPLLAGVAAAPERVVLALYGPAYTGAAPFLVGLAVYQLLVSQSRPIAATLKGLDRPDIVVRLSVVCFGLDVLLGVVAFFALGPVGVVVATVVAQSVWLGLGALVLRKRFDALAVPRELGVQAVGGVATYATVGFVAPLLPWVSWLSLVVTALSGGSAYVGVLLLSPATRAVVADLTPV